MNLSLFSKFDPKLHQVRAGFNFGRLFKNIALSLFFLLLLLPYIITATRLHYTAYNNSSDTFLYFDIAKNFISGRGLTLTFNPYQYWSGVFYPAVPFVHVGFSLFLSLLYFFLPSIQKLIYFNFVFAFINLWLIYLIFKRLYGDKFLSIWAAAIIASSVSMEITLLRLFTEQLSLFITLLAVHFYISKKEFRVRDFLLLGLLLGLGFFIRSSTVCYCAAFILAVLFSNETKQVKKNALWILVPALLIPALYAMYVFLKYKVLFPQYPKVFHDYYLANFVTGGNFFNLTPVVRPYFSDLSSVYGLNIVNMFLALFIVLNFLLFFVLTRSWKVFLTRSKNELLFVWLSIVIVWSTIFLYSDTAVAEFQWPRFLLLPVIFSSALGIMGLRDFAMKFLPRTGNFLCNLLLFAVLSSNILQSGLVLSVYWKNDSASVRVAGLDSVYKWVKSNIGPDETVAVSLFLLGRVYLERPTVVLPVHKALNFNNLRDFLAIYRPKAIIFDNSMPSKLRSDLEKIGYRNAFFKPLSGLYWVFIPSAT